MRFPVDLVELPTPALLIDRQVLQRNATAMQARAQRLGVRLRPHMKTAKAVEVAEIATAVGSRRIAVATLKEAAFFFEYGFNDITCAIGITPERFEAAATLLAAGCDLSLLVDSALAARSIASRAAALDLAPRVLLELDCGLRRGGLVLDDPALLETSGILHAAPTLRFEGIYTHGGHAYDHPGPEALRRIAEQERADAVAAAKRLETQGIVFPEVCVGSTPTAMHAASLEDVTELHPGNYLFFDLFQAELGSCDAGDIAISVLASVIGHRPDLNQLLIDSGHAALSAYRPSAGLWERAGYGLIRVGDGPGLRITRTEQEHGIIEGGDAALDFGALPIGARVRIIPVSANATAAMHTALFVVEDDAVVARWERTRGW